MYIKPLIFISSDPFQSPCLVEYYKGLIRIRKAYSPLRDNTVCAVMESYVVYNGQSIAVTIRNHRDNEWSFITIIINNNPDNSCLPEVRAHYQLPDAAYVIANGDKASDKAIGVYSRQMPIPPRSALVITDKYSYDRINGISDEHTNESEKTDHTAE